MKLTAEEFELAEGSSRVCMVSQLSWDCCAIPLISKPVSVCEVGLRCCILDSSWFTCDKARRGAEINNTLPFGKHPQYSKQRQHSDLYPVGGFLPSIQHCPALKSLLGMNGRSSCWGNSCEMGPAVLCQWHHLISRKIHFHLHVIDTHYKKCCLMLPHQSNVAAWGSSIKRQLLRGFPVRSLMPLMKQSQKSGDMQGTRPTGARLHSRPPTEYNLQFNTTPSDRIFTTAYPRSRFHLEPLRWQLQDQTQRSSLRLYISIISNENKWEVWVIPVKHTPTYPTTPFSMLNRSLF